MKKKDKFADKEFREKFHSFCLDNGISPDRLFSETNWSKYVDTAVDGFTDYPLFLDVCRGTYKAKTIKKIFGVDARSRLNTTLGLATDEYESILLIEPPSMRKVGFLDYARVVKLNELHLLFIPISVRQQNFENFAKRKRKLFLDDRTIYAYMFATQMKYQRQGYGKKLFSILIRFAKENGYRICLETNKKDNAPLYEKFGFEVALEDVYKNRVEHLVMIFDPDKSV